LNKEAQNEEDRGQSGADDELSVQDEIQAAAYLVNPTMNYQGYLSDSGGNPVNDTVAFTASLYDAPTGGSRRLYWEQVTVFALVFGVVGQQPEHRQGLVSICL
jgi:hypothetical protein